MKWIRTICTEIFGLFVDDGSFALAILVWVVIAAFGLPRLGVPPVFIAPIFAAGLMAFLLESAVRFARRKHLSK